MSLKYGDKMSSTLASNIGVPSEKTSHECLLQNSGKALGPTPRTTAATQGRRMGHEIYWHRFA